MQIHSIDFLSTSSKPFKFYSKEVVLCHIGKAPNPAPVIGTEYSTGSAELGSVAGQESNDDPCEQDAESHGEDGDGMNLHQTTDENREYSVSDGDHGSAEQMEHLTDGGVESRRDEGRESPQATDPHSQQIGASPRMDGGTSTSDTQSTDQATEIPLSGLAKGGNQQKWRGKKQPKPRGKGAKATTLMVTATQSNRLANNNKSETTSSGLDSGLKRKAKVDTDLEKSRKKK